MAAAKPSSPPFSTSLFAAAAAAPPPPPPPPAGGSVSSRLLPNGLAVIEINRPGKLNALDSDCCDAVSASLLAFEKLVAKGGSRGEEAARSSAPSSSDAAAAVLPRALLLAGSRSSSKRVSFCAGGDVRAIREAALARPVISDGDEEEGEGEGGEALSPRGGGGEERRRRTNSKARFPLPPRGHPCERVFQADYAMLSLLSSSPLPVLALADGVQMGLGAGLSLAALSSGGGRGVCVVTDGSLWAMPEGKIGLFPDVGFLAAAPGIAPRVAANAEEAAAAVASSSSWSPASLSSSSPSEEKKKKKKKEKKRLLFSAEAALLFGLTGARIEGGEALVAAGLASFCVRSSEGAEGAEGGGGGGEEGGSAGALRSALSRADFSGNAAETLASVTATVAASAAAAAAAAARESPPSSSSSLLLLEAAAEGGSLRPSLRRALDFRSRGEKEEGEEEEEGENCCCGGGGGDNKKLSRSLLALRREWEALSAGGCEAAKSALEAWLGAAAAAARGSEAAAAAAPASCPLSSALTLRLASDAEISSSSSPSSSSLWSSDPAAALRKQLEREFAPAARLAVSEAFAEGVRATLVEKGKGAVNWPSYCSSLERVEDSDVDALLASAASAEESGPSGGLDVEGYLSRGCSLD